MDDLISRQAAIKTAIEWYDTHFRDGESIAGLATGLKNLPSAQPEITQKEVEQYCHKRCLTVITNDLFHEMSARFAAQPERQVELDGTESNIEILSELRAQFNCFDEAEEPVYRALSDAIYALSSQPEQNNLMADAHKRLMDETGGKAVRKNEHWGRGDNNEIN